ncbi:MAG: hypothetical protein J5586_01820 [Clostridia bacterium]|nr:hypothetical protein [Clostridia bacterium]
MKKTLCIILAILFAAALAGCGRSIPERERLRQYDLADGDWSTAVLPITLRRDGRTIMLCADVNIAAVGKYCGRFRASEEQPMPYHIDFERYDGCRMYRVLDADPKRWFILENGGQYLLAMVAEDEKDGGPARDIKKELEERDLLNRCIRINGAMFCSVAAVKLAACGEVCSAATEPDWAPIRIDHDVITRDYYTGYLFGDHPSTECVILSDGQNAILFASTDYLETNGAELVREARSRRYRK